MRQCRLFETDDFGSSQPEVMLQIQAVMILNYRNIPEIVQNVVQTAGGKILCYQKKVDLLHRPTQCLAAHHQTTCAPHEWIQPFSRIWLSRLVHRLRVTASFRLASGFEKIRTQRLCSNVTALGLRREKALPTL